MVRARLTSPFAADGKLKLTEDYTLNTCVQVCRGVPPAAIVLQIECADDVWEKLSADPEYQKTILAMHKVPG